MQLRFLFFSQRKCRIVLALFLLLFGFVFAIWFVFKPQPAPTPAVLPSPPSKLIQVGDWILRNGNGAESRIIRRLSHGNYSHIGMIIATEPQLLIAHATTDDAPNQPNQVIISTWQAFANEKLAQNIAIVRPHFLSLAQRQASARYAAAQQGKAFILAPANEPHYYCTTLMSEAIRSQMPSFAPKWQTINLALYEGQYLFPDSFTHEPIEWVYKASFPKPQ